MRVISFLFALAALLAASYVTYHAFVIHDDFQSPLDRPLNAPIVVALFAAGLSQLWYAVQPHSKFARSAAAIVAVAVLASAAFFIFAYLQTGIVKPAILVLFALYILWHNFVRQRA